MTLQPTEVCQQPDEPPPVANVCNAQTEDDVYRPIMDRLDDYVTYRSHSQGHFVPDFVEAAAGFEDYLVRVTQLEDIHLIGQYTSGAEVGNKVAETSFSNVVEEVTT